MKTGWALFPGWAVLAMLTAGCASRVADSRTEIRYLAWGNPEQIAAEQSFCDLFNSRNRDIHVKLTLVPSSAYRQKMILMLASRTAPDVIRVDHYDFPSLVGKGVFFDMTDLARNDHGFHATDFFPSTIREGTYKGRLYGLNVMFGGEIMYYNKTLFRQAGLEDPFELSKRGLWTYDVFRRDAIALTRSEDGRPVQFGVQIPGFPALTPFVWGFGGDLLSADEKRCVMDSPQAVRAMQFLANLRWKDHCSPSPAENANSAFQFESGRIGMVFDWSGMSVRYRKAIRNFEWDICPIPVGPAGGVSMIKGNQLVIYRESAHPAAAWRFVRFMTSPLVEMKLYGEMRRNFPTRKAVAYSRQYLDGTLEPHNTRAFVSAVETARELPINSRWSEWTNALNAQTDDLFSGRNLNAADVMRKAARAANDVLQDQEGF